MPPGRKRGGNEGEDVFVRRQVRQDMKAVPQKKAIELLREFEPLIGREAQRFARRTRQYAWFGVEDYFAVGQIAVMEAFLLFTPDNGATLKTWVGRVVKWRMAEAARRIYDPLNLVTSIQTAERAVAKGTGAPARVTAAYARAEAHHVEVSGFEYGGDLQPACPLPNPEEALDTKRAEHAVQQAVQDSMRALDVRERLIITAEMHGPPATELAEALGVSRARLYQQRAQAHDDLKDLLSGRPMRPVLRRPLLRLTAR